MRRLEILGKRYGMLIAIEELPKLNGMRQWRLKCDCGGERIALQKTFANGKMRSCGCDDMHSNVKHRLSKTPEYRAWINMKTRCSSDSAPYFEYYGGRGITVCDRWLSSFEKFYSDMGKRPGSAHSVDRIDVNGNYEPDNCRWATGSEQSRNQRRNHIVEFGGRVMTLAEAVESSPVPYNTVLYRLKRGWQVDDAVTRTAQKGGKPNAP